MKHPPSDIKLQQAEVARAAQYCRTHNTAVLTILFSDIVGFTGFTEAAGESASIALREVHDALFVDTVTRDGAGEIIKQIGDSFLAVFAEPSTAVRRALEFQYRISERRDEFTFSEYSLGVRIGIHMGQVSIDDRFQHDIFGRHVNRASRIESIAAGGQILCSQSVWDNAAGWLNETEFGAVSWRTCGKARLKGISDPVQIYEFSVKERGYGPVPGPILSRRRRVLTLRVSLILAILAVVILSFLYQERVLLERTSAPAPPSSQPDTIYLGSIQSYSNVSQLEAFRGVYRSRYLHRRIIPDDIDLPPLSQITDRQRSDFEDQLLSSVISFAYPDYVVITRDDIEQGFLDAGKIPPDLSHRFIYNKVPYNSFSSGPDSSLWFILRDVGADISLFPHVYEADYAENLDSLLVVGVVMTNGGVGVRTGSAEGPADVSRLCLEFIQLAVLFSEKGKVIGVISEVEEDIAIIDLYSESELIRTGAILQVARLYRPYSVSSDSGVQERIRDLELVKEASGDTVLWENVMDRYYWSPSELLNLRQGTMRHKSLGGKEFDLPLTARVRSVTESTAVVDIIQGKVPGVTVRAGDRVRLKLMSPD